MHVEDNILNFFTNSPTVFLFRGVYKMSYMVLNQFRNFKIILVVQLKDQKMIFLGKRLTFKF